MKPRTEPLTRYWFIDQLAKKGTIAKIDEDGWITRPLRPHDPPTEPASVQRSNPLVWRV